VVKSGKRSEAARHSLGCSGA